MADQGPADESDKPDKWMILRSRLGHTDCKFRNRSRHLRTIGCGCDQPRSLLRLLQVLDCRGWRRMCTKRTQVSHAQDKHPNSHPEHPRRQQHPDPLMWVRVIKARAPGNPMRQIGDVACSDHCHEEHDPVCASPAPPFDFGNSLWVRRQRTCHAARLARSREFVLERRQCWRTWVRSRTTVTPTQRTWSNLTVRNRRSSPCVTKTANPAACKKENQLTHLGVVGIRVAQVRLWRHCPTEASRSDKLLSIKASLSAPTT